MTKPISRKMAVDCLLFRFTEVLYHFMRPDGSFPAFVCLLCRNPLLPGQSVQFDHIHADCFDGPHEYQNLRPVHAECHFAKTRLDVKALAKVKRLANPKPSKRPMKSSGRTIPARPFGKSKPFQKRGKNVQT